MFREDEKHQVLGFKREKREYLTIYEMGAKWGITSRMVKVFCNNSRIKRAF